MRLVWLLSKRTVKNYDGTIFISDTLFLQLVHAWELRAFEFCLLQMSQRGEELQSSFLAALLLPVTGDLKEILLLTLNTMSKSPGCSPTVLHQESHGTRLWGAHEKKCVLSTELAGKFKFQQRTLELFTTIMVTMTTILIMILKSR